MLLERAAPTLVREMPVKATARTVGITDKRFWRIVFRYARKALAQVDYSKVTSIGLDETASKRGHNCVTVFIDMDKTKERVLFATSGKGKNTIKEFRSFLKARGGSAANRTQVVCDMSQAFLSGVKQYLHNANVTIDWFHIVQKAVKAVDDTRMLEHRKVGLPKGARFAVLKGKSKPLTSRQAAALSALLEMKGKTASAWQIKKALGWIRNAESAEQAEYRINVFIEKAQKLLEGHTFT